MRRTLLLLASLIFVALGSIAHAQIPNVPDTSRYVAYNVTSATTNFDVPFALYGDCTDLTVKIAGVVQTGGFTCISKSLTPFANVAQPITDAQVQFTSAVSNSLVEIIGARHPRFSMGNAPGITRTEFNRNLGTIFSAQRELYDKTIPLGAATMAGFGLPSVGIGASGSYYLDLTTGNVYGPKTNAWPANPAFSPSVFTPLNPNLAFVTGAAGVICDGVTDANAGGALQAVINNAATAKRRLFFPPAADCHIKTAYSFPSNADWEGFGTTISFDATVNTAGSLNVAMSLDNAANWRISGITFNGPGSAAINQNARVAGLSPSNGLITNSTFQNFGTQVAFTGTLTNGSPTITSVSSVAGLKNGMTVSLNNANIGTITGVGTSTITISPAATSNGASSLLANFYAQGLLAFGPTNITVQASTIQNNSGDGIAFSNNARGSRILYNKFSNNQDSQIVPCTIGGSDNQVVGNTVTAPSGVINPAIVLDRCQNSVVSSNTVSSGAGSNGIRIARYADSTDINQDNKIIGNTVSGGGNISVESSSTTQGSQSVPKGGLFKVIGNNVISPSGSGINVSDSSNGEVIGNAVTGAGAEGIFELAFSGNTGNNIISGNTIDGATYCLRQLAAGGTIVKSQYLGNDPRNCSVTPTAFVSADYFDRGNISGSAAIFPNFTGDVTSSGTTTTIATVNSNVGSFGGSTAIPNFTVNAKGQVTAAGTNVVIAPAGTLSGTALAAGVVTSSLTSVGTLTGGATGAGFTVNLGTSTVSGTLPTANTAPLTGDVTKSAGSNTTTLAAGNAANLNSGTLLAARMPALTGSCTTSAGTVAVTCEQDGAWNAFTPTVASSGTLPTTATASMRWKQSGTKTYELVLAYAVSTLGAGTAGFVTFTLPNSATNQSIGTPCAFYNASLGTQGGISAAYIAGSDTKVTLDLSSMAAQTYNISCTFEST